LKVTLYLLSQKGYEVLKALVGDGYAMLIEQVIIGKDKQVAQDYSKEIKNLCIIHNIIHKNRTEDYEVNAPYSVAVSWRWLIKNQTSKLIVLHDSLLPKYRGFAPLVNALINQEPEVGVSALFASDYYDEGEIINQLALPVTYPAKIKTMIESISTLYTQLALELFEKIKTSKTISSTPQNEDQASYSLWRNEDDYLINWNESAEQILNFIYAVSEPYKGATTYIDGKQKIRILDACIEPNLRIENRDVGKVIFVRNNLPVVVCAKGLLKIIKALDDKTGSNVLPFERFRIRLTNFHLNV